MNVTGKLPRKWNFQIISYHTRGKREPSYISSRCLFLGSRCSWRQRTQYAHSYYVNPSNDGKSTIIYQDCDDCFIWLFTHSTCIIFICCWLTYQDLPTMSSNIQIVILLCLLIGSCFSTVYRMYIASLCPHWDLFSILFVPIGWFDANVSKNMLIHIIGERVGVSVVKSITHGTCRRHILKVDSIIWASYKAAS